MSLLPYFCEFADELDYFHSHFFPHHHHWAWCPWWCYRCRVTTKRKEQLTVSKDGFQVVMDVQHYNPKEITVKTFEDTVIIEGLHKEKEPGRGSISRHFVRKYTLPKGYDSKKVTSSLSSDGILTVKAPPPSKTIQSEERIVEIEHTGPSKAAIKDNPDKKDRK